MSFLVAGPEGPAYIGVGRVIDVGRVFRPGIKEPDTS
jgi:hypothetical protein